MGTINNVFLVPEVVWIPYLNGCFENKTYFAHLKVESKEQCQFKCQIKDKCAVAEYISEKKLCKLATHYHYKSISDCGRRSVLFIKGNFRSLLSVHACSTGNVTTF